MIIVPGTLLIATPIMDDPNFDGATLLITTCNEQGTTGFIINKLFGRRFNELAEFSNSPAFPLYAGGPVGHEHVYFIHHRPDLVKDGTLVTGNTYIGGDFKQAVAHINNKTLSEKDVQLFIGYCGWDAGELEEECVGGFWENS